MDALAIAAWVTVGVLIVGYLLDRKRIVRSNGKKQGEFEGTITSTVKSLARTCDEIKATIGKLPCSKHTYLQDLGITHEKVSNLEDRMDTAEEELRGIGRRRNITKKDRRIGEGD